MIYHNQIKRTRYDIIQGKKFSYIAPERKIEQNTDKIRVLIIGDYEERVRLVAQELERLKTACGITFIGDYGESQEILKTYISNPQNVLTQQVYALPYETPLTNVSLNSLIIYPDLKPLYFLTLFQTFEYLHQSSIKFMIASCPLSLFNQSIKKETDWKWDKSNLILKEKYLWYTRIEGFQER